MNDELTDQERRMLEIWTAVEPPPEFADRVIALAPGRRWVPYAMAAVGAVAAAAILVLVLRPEVGGEPAVGLAPRTQVATGLHPDAGATTVAPIIGPSPGVAPYDLDLEVGETATVHDPRGKAAINFHGRSCPAGMQVAVSRDSEFRSRTANQGTFGVVLAVEAGEWAYRASCMSGGMPEAPFASGRVVVLRDGGSRPLPVLPKPVTVQANGLTWTVGYARAVPQIVFERPAGGERLHLSHLNNELGFDVRRNQRVALPDLADGRYEFWFTRGGLEVGTRTVLNIVPDGTAAQIVLEAPLDGALATGSLTVVGATLPGWRARFEATEIPVDAEHRFTARVELRPGFKTLALRFDHPRHGTHYYLRHLR